MKTWLLKELAAPLARRAAGYLALSVTAFGVDPETAMCIENMLLVGAGILIDLGSSAAARHGWFKQEGR